MEALDLVKQSYGRACLNPKFFDRFYAIFLESHPSIKPMFTNTQMAQQKQLLRTGVAMLISHVEGKAAGTMTLDRIRKSHAKNKMNIRPELYQYWINSLVTATQEFDAKWTPDLERAWKKVLRTGVDYIVEQYNKA